MNTIRNFIIAIIGIALITGLNSCDDFLEEENLSSSTDDTYLTSESAFEELAISAYSSMRNIARFNTIYMYGTDIFTRNAKIQGDVPLNDYTNLRSDDGTVLDVWTVLYEGIAECNTVISRADEIAGLNEGTKVLRLAEVKTIRAWFYFILVQQFGDIPIVDAEITTVKSNFTRSSEESVYNFIISDLEEIISDLPSTTEEFGRITQGAAKHLLAKVYLTKGYKTFGSSSDFEEATALAENVINNYDFELLNSFEEVMDYNNQINNEVILSIQFSSEIQYNSIVNDNGLGNNRHMLCKFGYDSYPGMSRTSEYGKPLNLLMPTDFYYNLYSDADAREEATFSRAIIADETATYEGWSIAPGDTVIYFPKSDWTDTQKESVNYWVFNQSDRFKSSEFTNIQFPFLHKFDDPDAEYSDDGEGTRDAYVFRLSETYLIAAEAYLKLNQPGKALPFINAVRGRAAKAGMENDMLVAEADIDIDFLLDEYARELGGETFRWCELKRTGKLSERVVNNNPHVALHSSSVDAHFLVRPIPESEIELTDGSLTQNPDYN